MSAGPVSAVVRPASPAVRPSPTSAGKKRSNSASSWAGGRSVHQRGGVRRPEGLALGEPEGADRGGRVDVLGERDRDPGSAEGLHEADVALGERHQTLAGSRCSASTNGLSSGVASASASADSRVRSWVGRALRRAATGGGQLGVDAAPVVGADDPGEQPAVLEAVDQPAAGARRQGGGPGQLLHRMCQPSWRLSASRTVYSTTDSACRSVSARSSSASIRPCRAARVRQPWARISTASSAIPIVPA